MYAKIIVLILINIFVNFNAFASNTATGTNALASLTTGTSNTANGYNALY